ncbi:MAG: N-acetylmuramoyl-L-alanine amidase [Calditrichae bacterium]|nr:N-acetylmuramoyl-L-alanine amidase [Calditrichota bacterium]MCB9058339.1 N-acetylmuramoyl-L-alanine amidase [Calditrichia bacterium]
MFLRLLPLIIFVACAFKPAATHHVPKPHIISKDEWGGKAPTNDIVEQQISKITIHHGGVDVPEDKDPIEYMRNLQSFSIDEKHWIDIPYHFCIDLDGAIYEARPLKYPGDTNTEYNPDGHALICVIGNYENQKIKPSQLDAIVNLSAWLADKYNIPVTEIASHKDYSTMTVCPGADLYKYLQDGTIVKRVQEILDKSKQE